MPRGGIKVIPHLMEMDAGWTQRLERFEAYMARTQMAAEHHRVPS
jgi:hypothetical protein